MSGTSSAPVAKAYSYVRMSTDIQLKGDSLRRQLQLSREFAEKGGLELVEDFALHDIGVSAFKGANVTGGALGTFLDAVKQRRIDPGSYLLVESLDRISRQEIVPALSVFMDLAKAGINIATLADGRIYRAGQTEMADLMYSIMVMSRAHEESATKSHRLRSAWANKRKNIQDRKLTRLCPAWLTLSPDRKQFEVDKARVEIVCSIFHDSAAGIGSYSIARRLNQARVKPFGRSTGWQPSYVTKILTNRAVLGEFQPSQMKSGKRAPVGDAIADYFPAVVDRELFQRVQQSRDARKVGAGGRRGARISNIFSGLATCGYCHARMHFVNKGPRPKGGTYLMCDRARRGLQCDATGWRYEDLEASVLALVQELDLESLLSSADDDNKRAVIGRAIAALEGEQLELVQRRERTYQLIDDPSSPTKFIQAKLDELETSIARVEFDLAARKAELSSLELQAGRVYRSRDEIQALIERLQNKTEDDVYALRAALAARLKAIVLGLEVYPKGTGPGDASTIAMLNDVGAFGNDENGLAYRQRVIEHLEWGSTLARSKLPLFSVAFRDGRIRVVYPDPRDPLRFEQQILAGFQKWPTILAPDGSASDMFPQADHLT